MLRMYIDILYMEKVNKNIMRQRQKTNIIHLVVSYRKYNTKVYIVLSTIVINHEDMKPLGILY